MTESLTAWTKKVQAVLPDLKIEHLELNQDGLINDVVIVNHSLVFRFSKTEEYAAILENEAHILELIQLRLSLAVPRPIYTGNGVLVYPLLEGLPLLFEDVLELDLQSRQNLAAQLGEFLHGLHTVPITGLSYRLPQTRAYVTRQDWAEFKGQFQEKAYPLLQNHQVHWIERFFAMALDDPQFFSYPPALIHGDLAPYHILFSPTEQRISGVIDFGMAGLGDPASDFGILISIYGERFVTLMGAVYPGLEKLLPRARFYAQSIELEWVYRGLDSGENFWFTGHLGGARDIHQ
jgi:aminoglycoside 2''-phosphotransferase